MAMNFNRLVDTQGPTIAAAPKMDTMMEVQPFNIMADRQEVVAQLAGSDEIEALTAAIDINDLNSIVSFGSQSAEEISKASDIVLRSMNLAQLDESSKMLQTLAKIMDPAS